MEDTENKKEFYESIPVEVCANATCSSLAIVEDDGIIYCRDCGCTKTIKCSIDQWKDYYFIAHGKNLIEDKSKINK